MQRARTIVGALALASTLALVAAGCGSSDSSGSGSGAATTAAGGASAMPVALDGKVNDKGSKDVSGDGAKASVAMELDDNYYSPTFIKAAPGATVTIEIANEGSNPHTFTLDDGSVDQQVAPGAKATVKVTVPKSGSLRFSCNFHGDMGMQGALYSGDGAASSSSATSTTTEAAGSKGGY